MNKRVANATRRNRALRLRFPVSLMLVVFGLAISSCGPREPSQKMEIVDDRHVAIDVTNAVRKDNGAKVSVGELRVELRSVEELQVKPPDGLNILPAAKGEIRILPDSLICMARFISEPLQERLKISPNVGIGGPTVGAFNRIMIANKMPRPIKGASRFPVIRPSDNILKLQWYQNECRWRPENIYVDMTLSMNEENNPYQFKLTVRQNNRAWHHVVRRSSNSLHPSNFVNAYLLDNESAKIEGSVIADAMDAANLLESYVRAGINE